MRPLLAYLADGKEHSNQDIYAALENAFTMTVEEKRALLPSGKQRVFVNRVAWAKSHLKQAGLLDSQKRGYYRITTEGASFLEKNKKIINCRMLMQFPEYVKFRSVRKNGVEKEVKTNISTELKTPEEYIDLGYKTINQKVSGELISNIKSCSPHFFEKLVIDLLLAMGYGGSRQEAGRITGRGSDEGIDGIINEDKLGLDVIYVQAKRWENSVGRPDVQKFAGALQGKRAKKGIYITTSSFTKEAEEYARSIESKIVLIDGDKLAELMIDHNIGVSTVQLYEIKKVDSDYFLED